MYSQLFNFVVKVVKDKDLYNINRMETYQEIISRLKFIGKLKKGEKINTKQLYVHQEGLLTTISRTFWYQDNRINALNFISETVKYSFELLNNYDKSELIAQKELAKILFNDLIKVIQGLYNIKDTYIIDTKFCCDIDTTIEDIKSKLVIFEDKYIVEINQEQD